MTPIEQPVRDRYVILGASNVSLAFPMLVQSLSESTADPLEILSAHGHGRSYGRWSYFLARGLPPIIDCRLWEDLENRPPAERTSALVTDIGNDLIYGRSVDEICCWVATCLERLQNSEARTTCVLPPVERVMHLAAWQYHLVKRLLFLGPTVPWPTIRDRLVQLEERLRRLADQCDSRIVVPEPDWYRLDPIHIAAGARAVAWRTILNASPGEAPIQVISPPPRALRTVDSFRHAAEYRYFGQTTRTNRPALHQADRLTVWRY